MLYFLNNKGKKTYTYIHIVFITFILIFKFILIYLLHVLLVFKIKGIFKKKIPTQKEIISFIYSIDINIKQNYKLSAESNCYSYCKRQ